MENINKIKSIKSILVTNTRAYSDGNSVAAELAALIAQNGKRVALVDADLRRPLIHSLFDLPNRVGLVDILQEKRSLSAVMHSVNSNQLFVLTAGKLTGSGIDLFALPKMSSLLSQLNAEYDKVIIHGPPFFYSEATSLAGKVDGVVLLIHPGHTKSDPSQAIMEKFQKTGATIIGIVMRDQPKYQVNQSAFIDKLLTYDRRARLTP
ncbi:MAG: CpsD/CapB family tyrosine-protein kinase [Anaerolineaceae bacterium]|jgi:capsular exopolysaccharide synthesis family protein|nr:CpsD/CapB family tyrosine-protein kinase [Anaerolineaceae bacterium]